MIMRQQSVEAEWNELWRIWWSTLDQIEVEVDDPWDPAFLAMFLDVPSLGLRDLVPEVVDSEFARDFDLVAEVCRSARIGIERIEASRGELMDRCLHLEPCTTEMLLRWEWMKGLRRGEKTMAFINRMRELWDGAREIELDSHTVAQFIFRLAHGESEQKSATGTR